MLCLLVHSIEKRTVTIDDRERRRVCSLIHFKRKQTITGGGEAIKIYFPSPMVAKKDAVLRRVPHSRRQSVFRDYCTLVARVRAVVRKCAPSCRSQMFEYFTFVPLACSLPHSFLTSVNLPLFALPSLRFFPPINSIKTFAQ